MLDWNEPSIGFYRSLGAVAQDEWTVFRLTDEPSRGSRRASPGPDRRVRAAMADDASGEGAVPRRAAGDGDRCRAHRRGGRRRRRPAHPVAAPRPAPGVRVYGAHFPGRRPARRPAPAGCWPCPSGGAIVGIGWWLQRRHLPSDVSVGHALANPGSDVPVPQTIVDCALQIIAVGFGASLGREGAPRQFGAAGGAFIARRLGHERRPAAHGRGLRRGRGPGRGLQRPARRGGVHDGDPADVVRMRELGPALAASGIATVVAWPVLSDRATYEIPTFALTPSILIWAVCHGTAGRSGRRRVRPADARSRNPRAGGLASAHHGVRRLHRSRRARDRLPGAAGQRQGTSRAGVRRGRVVAAGCGAGAAQAAGDGGLPSSRRQRWSAHAGSGHRRAVRDHGRTVVVRRVRPDQRRAPAR